ncbi:MAG: DUF4115 domain-containing protein [Sneathiella sp.]|nr:DUF4115 domain-containing protein [Sneathiella sp.]
MVIKKNLGSENTQRIFLKKEGAGKSEVRKEPNLFTENSDFDTDNDSTSNEGFHSEKEASLTVGERLRFARESKSYSLHEMADTLRLRPRQIQALEDGDYDNLPGQAFVIGFLRSYANALGLDAIAIVELYKQEHAGEMTIPQLTFPEPTSEGRMPGSGLLIGTCLAAAVAFGGWYFYLNENKGGVEVVSDLPNRLFSKLQSAIERPDLEQNKPLETPELTQSSILEKQQPETQVSQSNQTDIQKNTVEIEASQSPVSNVLAEDQVSAVMPETPELTVPSVMTSRSDLQSSAISITVPENISPDQGISAAPDELNEENVENSAEVIVKEDPSQANSVVLDIDKTLDNSDAVVAEKQAVSQNDEEQIEKLDDVNEPIGTASNVPVFEQETLIEQEPQQENQISTELYATDTDDVIEATSDNLGIQNTDARVVIMAHQETWIQIITEENAIILERIFGAGDSFMVPSQMNLRLNTANAAGVEIRLDGQVLSSLGGIGAIVRELNLNPESLQELFSVAQ